MSLIDDLLPGKIRYISGPVSFVHLKSEHSSIFLFGDIHNSIRESCDRCKWSIRTRCSDCIYITDDAFVRLFPLDTTFFVEDQLPGTSPIWFVRIRNWWNRQFGLCSKTSPMKRFALCHELQYNTNFHPVDIRIFHSSCEQFFFEPLVTLFLFIATDRIGKLFKTSKPTSSWIRFFFNQIEIICERHHLSVHTTLLEFEAVITAILTHHPSKYFSAIYHNTYFQPFSYLHHQLQQIVEIAPPDEVEKLYTYLFQHIEYIFEKSQDSFQETWAYFSSRKKEYKRWSYKGIVYYSYLTEAIHELFTEALCSVTPNSKIKLYIPYHFKLIYNYDHFSVPSSLESCIFIEHYTILRWLNEQFLQKGKPAVFVLGEFHVCSIHHFMVNIAKWFTTKVDIKNNHEEDRLRCIDVSHLSTPFEL